MHIITESTDPSRVLKRLANFKVVSFDIFDTLISRMVPHPHDVFSVVESEFNHRHPQDAISGFREARVLAEQRVRAANDYKEVTFDMIYGELLELYGSDRSQKLADVELIIEHQLSIPKPIGRDVFAAAKEAGLKIILTSDMYLPKDFIGRLLSKHAIDGYSDLFVSAELNSMKSDGTLYDLIYQKLGIKANEMIHLGDNLKSDYLWPMRKGGGSYWVPKPRVQQALGDESCLRKFLHSKETQRTIEEDIGYSKLGPLLFGFSHWLRCKAKENKVDRLLFLARDGKLMQEAFNCVNGDAIPNDYLYVSRQVLVLPTLWMHPELEDIEQYASISEKSDIGSVLERMGVRDSIDQSLLEQFSLTFEHEINGTQLSASDSFVKLYEAIRPQVIKRSVESYHALLSYLQKLQLSGKVGVVDIGWGGSMQRAFAKILDSAGIDVELTGYYFGANPTSKHVAEGKGSYNGYLFEYGKSFDNYIKQECFRNVLETLFLARHGSVRAIHKDGSIELYDYEYEAIEASISELQKSSIQFVKDYSKSVCSAIVDPDHACYYQAIFKMGLMPEKAEAKFFGHMKFFDVGIEYLAKVEGKDVLRQLLKSKWKTGYLVNLTGVRLPYHLMIQWIIGRRLK